MRISVKPNQQRNEDYPIDKYLIINKYAWLNENKSKIIIHE